MQGEIQNLPLSDLIQWLAYTRRSGKLVVTRGASGAIGETRHPTAKPGSSVELYFADGEIAAAANPGSAVFDNADNVRARLGLALAWRTGHFAFNAGPLPFTLSSTNLHLSADKLLREVGCEFGRSRPLDVTLNPDGWVEAYAHIIKPADAFRLEIIDQLMREDLSIPAMPELATRVLELTRDDNFSLRELSDLVLTNQAIAAQILRYANSVLFCSAKQLDSLVLAVQRLGAQEVINIVLATSLQSRRTEPDLFAKQRRRGWTHSLAAAFFARSLAPKVKLNGNLGYLCGLLMDFGITILYSLIQDVLSRRATAANFRSELIEQIVKDYHQCVGRMVGEKWQLPQTVIEVMAYHHCLGDPVSHNPYIAVAALADYLANLALSVPRGALEGFLADCSAAQLAAHPAARLINFGMGEATAVLSDLPSNLDLAFAFVTD